MMPRLYLSGLRQNFTAQRIVAPVNRISNSPQRVADRPNDDRSTTAFPTSFHTKGVAHDRTDFRQETDSVFRF